MSDRLAVLRDLKAGKLTLFEAHVAALDMRCGGCGRPASTRIQTFCPVADAYRMFPNICALLAAGNEGVLPTVRFKPKGSDEALYIMTADMGACALCRATALRAAAAGPSWSVVHVTDPPKDTVQVTVGATH